MAKKKKTQQEIQEMRDMPYSDYLRTTHYINLAKKIKVKANYTCSVCGITNKQLGVMLNAHHTTYDNLGDAELEENDLVCLCSACHIIEHKFTSTVGFHHCKVCENDVRYLNMIADTSQYILYKDSNIVYHTYMCPYCQTTNVNIDVDVKNIQKLYKLNSYKGVGYYYK